MSASKPERMGPPPADDDDEPEATREAVEKERRRQAEKTVDAKTRRSWYTTTAAANALADVVDDIHFATRVPKHEVVAALMEAAVAQAPKVQARLQKQVGDVR